MYVYIKSELNRWTVGFYRPMAPDEIPVGSRPLPHMGLNYRWQATRDCSSEAEAQRWTSYLNGGALPSNPSALP